MRFHLITLHQERLAKRRLEVVLPARQSTLDDEQKRHKNKKEYDCLLLK